MKKIVKQIVGIDVAQDELVCCFGNVDEFFSITFISRYTFVNNKTGFEKFHCLEQNFDIFL